MPSTFPDPGNHRPRLPELPALISEKPTGGPRRRVAVLRPWAEPAVEPSVCVRGDGDVNRLRAQRNRTAMPRPSSHWRVAAQAVGARSSQTVTAASATYTIGGRRCSQNSTSSARSVALARRVSRSAVVVGSIRCLEASKERTGRRRHSGIVPAGRDRCREQGTCRDSSGCRSTWHRGCHNGRTERTARGLALT
jgi:hypothetical protein